MSIPPLSLLLLYDPRLRMTMRSPFAVKVLVTILEALHIQRVLSCGVFALVEGLTFN